MTVTAVTVSWFGVRLGVAPALTDEPPVAIDVNRRYTEIRFGLDETVPPTAPSPSAKPSPSKAGPPSAPPSRAATTRPAVSEPAATEPVTTEPATVAPAGTAASPSPSGPDRRPRYRVTADGGSIVVAYSPTRVDIVDADPRSGHTATGARRSDTVVVARLSAPGHTSVITAYWSGGPAAQIVEEYRS